MSVRIDRTQTEGTFSLDGGTWEVENNVWVIGDEDSCVVIDPAHDLDAVAELVGSRRVSAVLLTHAHDDHSRLAPEAARRFDAPLLLHPAERPLWQLVHGEAEGTTPPFRPLEDGQRIPVGIADPADAGAPGPEAAGAEAAGAEAEAAGNAVRLEALHTPGHSPGSVCFFAPELTWEGEGPVLFSGDTLFEGGPGATGRSYSSYPTIVESIRGRLFELPERTVVLTGHGPATTIGAERAGSPDWEDPEQES